MDVKTYLEDHVLLFDGAMGTYYAEQYPEDAVRCEWANLTHPERIRTIHRKYLDAGAAAIKTNTFGVNTESLECSLEEIRSLIDAAWKNANDIVERDYMVFADIGPIVEAKEEYYFILDEFIRLGARNFLFETFSDDADLPDLVAYIRKHIPDAYMIASFAVTPDGFTRAGIAASSLLVRMKHIAGIDAVGLNCVSGPHHLLTLTRKNIAAFRDESICFSVMPNAGYPTVLNGRTVFDGSPAYFAARSRELVAEGVRILGGCCGTTPEHIRQTVAALKNAEVKIDEYASKGRISESDTHVFAENRIEEKIKAGKRMIAVELDPPADSNIEKFMQGAERLKASGVDAVTIADCPVARVRVDSSLLAAKLKRELDIDPIPHMTCRDRNINATKALLLGLGMEQVHNVLVVTGDPIPSAARDEVKGVFSFNSVVLADYIRQLSEQGLVQPFHVYGALNVNARNFDAELQKALRKQKAGVQTFLTQPVMTNQAFENLKCAYEALDATILGGVIPIVSHRNALFMSQEMAGIDIPEEIVQKYEGLDRENAEKLAVQLSVEFAQRMKPFTHGWYLITPFQRVSLIEKILKELF